jgi:hypothetical protein
MRRILGWIGAVFVIAAAGALPANALTTMEAPVNSNGARFAAPDPDQQLEQRLNGQDGDSQRGFSIQVRPQTRENDPNSSFDRRRSTLPWLPGQPFPSR